MHTNTTGGPTDRPAQQRPAPPRTLFAIVTYQPRPDAPRYAIGYAVDAALFAIEKRANEEGVVVDWASVRMETTDSPPAEEDPYAPHPMHLGLHAVSVQADTRPMGAGA